jgi:hypothetical protein
MWREPVLLVRFNHPLRVRRWLPVATAMPKMLKVLSRLALLTLASSYQTARQRPSPRGPGTRRCRIPAR